MHRMNETKSRSIVLPMAALVVLIVVGVVIASKHRRMETRNLVIGSNTKKGQSHLGMLSKFSVGTSKDISAVEDGLATPTTGVYYLPGVPSKCFIVQANPHGAQRGFEVEPADALSATMISGFAWVWLINPTRGKMMVWSSTSRKEVKWTYFGTSMIIDGVTYWRRPAKAAWQCKTSFTKLTPYHARSFPAANCQWLRYNPVTGGFLNYYTAVVGITFAAGGGHWDHVKQTGQVGGYHQSGALDGIYRMSRQPGPRGFLLWVGAVRFAGGAYDFIELTTCANPGYPTVTQQVGPPVPPVSTSSPQGPKTGAVSAPQCTLGTSKCVNGKMATTCTQIRQCCTSQTVQPSPTQYFSSCSAEVRGIFGTGWTLVRRVGPSHKVWHPATDGLAGTATYGSAGVSDTHDATFSVSFAHASFNQMLFTTGDCANWVLTSRSSVLNGYYANSPRTTCATSVSPRKVSQVRWYRRAGVREDPWLSVVDHFTAVPMGLIVYGEANFGSTHAKEIVPRNGANVYIRAKASLDSQGC